jgi:hypothetical protein
MKKRTAISITNFYLMVFALLMFTSGCGGGTNSAFSLPSLGAPPPPSSNVDGTSDGITDPTQFYVGIKFDPGVVAHVHAAAGFTSKCSIAKTAPNTDISCFIEVPEGDLFMNGLTMLYNTPAGLCKYVRRSTYWYYDKEVGVGPVSIGMNITKNASGDTTAFTCSVDGSPAGACSGFREVVINQKAETAECVYNNSAFGSANCCFGNYSITKNVTTPSTTLSQVINGTWGGDLKSCIGGAGRTNWTAYSKIGEPVTLVEKVQYGKVGEYKINAPVDSIVTPSNITIANYFNPTIHTHDGFISARSTTKPYFIDPVDDRSGSLINSGNDSYTFECLDEAFQLKHRISVKVREWDTYPDYLTYISTAGVTAIPDRGSTSEPGGCLGIEGPCNDQYDSDDFLNLRLALSSYDTTVPAVFNRGSYFPSDFQ